MDQPIDSVRRGIVRTLNRHSVEWGRPQRAREDVRKRQRSSREGGGRGSVSVMEDLSEPVVVRLLKQTIAFIHYEEAEVFQSEARRHVDVIHQAAGSRDEDVDCRSPNM